MTNDPQSPWDRIRKPASGFSVTRVDPDHPHDFFWGKDTQGSYLLLLEVEKELTEFIEKKTIELKGVKTDIRHNPQKGEYVFILCLLNKEDADIFHRLCIDLIERTKKVKVKKTALEIIFTRLERWKSFLSKKRSYMLSTKEVRGLFAELEFLHNCISRTDDQLVVIQGWQGPLDGPHDYVLGDYAVEIKSVVSSQRNSVRISSENQLKTHLDHLYLQVFFLAEFYDCKKGISLNQMVVSVRNAILNSDDRELFESRLFETGYMELKDYDTPCFLVTHQKIYEVREGFPRIIPSDLYEGLENVSYDLNLGSLDSYVCEFPFEGGYK